MQIHTHGPTLLLYKCGSLEVQRPAEGHAARQEYVDFLWSELQRLQNKSWDREGWAGKRPWVLQSTNNGAKQEVHVDNELNV